MNAEDRAKLRRILATFDEAGLIALANKGLVRRAEKDLEAGGLTHEETDTAVQVHGPGWTVTMPPDGPVHATDTTRATGVTRQILTATLYLRHHWTASSPPDNPTEISTSLPAPETPAAAQLSPEPSGETLRQALLDLSSVDLRKWAGKTVLREALALFRQPVQVEIETHVGLTIRLTQHEVEARLLPAAKGGSPARLLDQVLTTAPRVQHKRWVVAAVLALHQSAGRAIELPATTTAPEAAGSPITRRQVLRGTQELLEGMVSTGLAHPSDRMRQRLLTLSVSATAVHLPRLARLLRSLADDVALLLARQAAADTGQLFDLLCFAHAMAGAILASGPHPPQSLTGSHRTEYGPAGDLELAGVGAFPWETASGFEGVTVLFWDLTSKRFRTWTTSRPAANPGRFSMTQAYRLENIWSGGGSPERLSRCRFTLRQARVNAQGRLSGSQASAVHGLEAFEPAKADFADRLFTSWPALHDHARTAYPLGLTEKDPLDRLVILQPAAWGERCFDELQQRLAWPLQDPQGHPLTLTLPWVGVNEAAIAFLEAVNPGRDRLTRVVARIAFTPRGVRYEPLSLLGEGTPHGHRVLNPGFDQQLLQSRQSTLLEKLRKKYGRDRIATVMTSDEDDDSVTGLVEGVPLGIQSRLSEAEGFLLEQAETGLRRGGDAVRARFRELADSLDRGGLLELGKALREGDPGGARQVIWSGYLCRLHRQSLAMKGIAESG